VSYVESKAARSSNSAIRLDSSLFLGLAAVGCLVKYMEFIEGIVYASGTLHVKFLTIVMSSSYWL
jgi:hypothetical protein